MRPNRQAAAAGRGALDLTLGLQYRCVAADALPRSIPENPDIGEARPAFIRLSLLVSSGFVVFANIHRHGAVAVHPHIEGCHLGDGHFFLAGLQGGNLLRLGKALAGGADRHKIGSPDPLQDGGILVDDRCGLLLRQFLDYRLGRGGGVARLGVGKAAKSRMD